MIAQQQPLDRILRGLSRMTTHQDESLCCIPLVLVSEEDRHRLEPISGDQRSEPLCDAIRSLDDQAFSSWSLDEFRITQVDISELASWPSFAPLSEQASRIGIQSCWSIPIISSSQNALGLLLVFSPRKAKTTSHERQLLEAGSRLAAIAIEHRYLSELLAFQASHDSLTRLPNRSTFETRLEAAISKASQNNEQLAVIYVDLDRFKQVNDTFGHAVGDELLRQVSARLRRCVRHSDTVARIGGDEFSLLLPGLRDGCEANRVAESILQTFDSPFEIRGVEMSVTCSIGISLYPADGLDAATLQRNSDTAMYRVKKNGRNSFRCYTAELRPVDEPMISSEKVA
jgi:diguanylate cyclase (GGDEF)-like protein